MPDYVSRRKPRAHQVDALKAIDGQRAFAVLMGMRCGKSKVITDDFGKMVTERRALDLLIIAPAGAYLPWQGALQDDLPESIFRALRMHVWVSSKARSKGAQSAREAFMLYRGPRALIINTEALSSVLTARQFVDDFVCQRREQCVAVIDESVTIKNPESNAGKFVAARLGTVAGWRRIMSGLVSPRSPTDLWNQFKFLDPSILGFEDFVAFRARYEKVKYVCMAPSSLLREKLRALVGDLQTLPGAQMALVARRINPDINPQGMGRAQLRNWIDAQVEGMPRDSMIDAIQRFGGYVQSVAVVEGFQNLGELRDKIAPYSFRVRLEDCFDMPPVDYSFRDVEMTQEQARIYREMKQNATAILESLDHVTATHVVTQMLRLHQVLCGHAVDEEGTIHDVPEKRTAELCSMLEDYDAKAIIWVSYDRSMQKVVAALEKRYGAGSVARFWGGNVKTREAEEVLFKTDPQCRFMVATPDAGGMGRDWSVADWVIYFSTKNNLHHRYQSEDRAKAVGKMRPIAYTDMRVPGTVEDKNLQCLRNKIDMATVIAGDDWRKWLI